MGLPDFSRYLRTDLGLGRVRTWGDGVVEKALGEPIVVVMDLCMAELHVQLLAVRRKPCKAAAMAAAGVIAGRRDSTVVNVQKCE